MNSKVDLNTQPSAASTAKTFSAPRQLRVALLGYRSHPFVGGQGIYLKYLSRALKRAGHKPIVFSGPPYPDIDADIELVKVPSLDLYAKEKPLRSLKAKHLLSFSDSYEWWSKLSGSFAEPYCFARRVLKLIKNHDVDIVHDNQSLASPLLTLQNKGYKVVSTIHHPVHRDRELALSETRDKTWRLLIRRWYSFIKMQEHVVKKLEHVITVSKQSQKDIAHYFNRAQEKTTVISNGIDTDTFRPLSNIDCEHYTLFCTSSSDQALKGIGSLFDAVFLLKDKYPKLKLVLLGELKKGGANEKRLKKLKLEKHIVFKQALSTDQLVQQYNRSALVICPSLYEGFGLPAAEALACGRTVVSSDGGALPEVLGDAGFIYPAGDSKKLALLIEQLLDRPELRKQAELKARQHALKNFCWQRVAESLQTYYLHMLEAN
ncbi:glycosyltransferase family 4 protein [Agaribacterium haliotis]|uniref:glycosyltransferase family 4 protein n=1 Tax=Agaribacterium haliotis TaxID=2013869 RepID=UPI000BB53955|nr:glycosyltransferase family 4 protein [Agaribacterium haliotis]